MNRLTLNSKLKTTHRESFSRQSARIIVIDLTKPMNLHVLSLLVSEIENFFALVCCLKSNVRVPFLSIALLAEYCETLLPLQRITKATFLKISQCLLSVKQMLSDNEQTMLVDPNKISSLLSHILSDFSKQKNSVGLTTSLDITIFTCQSKAKMDSIAAKCITLIDTTHLKKINTVCLIDSKTIGLDLGVDALSTQQLNQDENEMGLSAGTWDVSSLDSEAFALECYLKKWLLDEGTDKEHLHLKLGDVTMKCDIQERVLNPAELPASSTFSLAVSNQGNSSNANLTTQCPIWQFKAIRMVPCSGVCESVVFGNPVVIRSSSCWQMEWDEIDRNQNYFYALCNNLSESNSCLILENLTPVYNQHRSFAFDVMKPNGIFILLPGNKCSMLLKSIASREILLPLEDEAVQYQPNLPCNATAEIDQCLKRLPTDETYNPVNTSSNLIACLQNGLKQPQQGRSNKRAKHSF